MINGLKGIRAVLFLLIFGTHYKYIIKNSIIDTQTAYHLLNNGGFAVLFFFLLSGFCTAIGYLNVFNELKKNEVKNFIIKRLKKFYPLYIFSGLLMLVFVLIPHNANWIYAFIFLYIPMLFPWTKFSCGGGNEAAWFLAALFFCYTMTPFLIFILNHIKTIKNHILFCIGTFSILIFIDIILLIFNKQNDTFFWRLPVLKLLEFSIGVGLGSLFKKYFWDIISKKKIKDTCKNALDIFIICLFFGCMFLYPHRTSNIFYTDLICIPIISICLFYLCIDDRNILQSFLSSKFILFLSDISFEGYLIHMVVMELLKPYCLLHINTIGGMLYIFILLFSLTIIFSFLYKEIAPKVLNRFNIF